MFNLKRKKILFIDHESGHGGSSISLFNKINLISKNPNYEVSVFLRKRSHLSQVYKKINVKVYYLNIPTITSVKTLTSNVIYLIKFFLKFLVFNFKNKNFYKKLEYYDLIHLNHENLYWLLRKIKTKTKVKLSISIRTILKNNFFSRLQSNIINDCADKRLFISKINLKNFNELVDIKKKRNFILENFALAKSKKNNFYSKKSNKKILKVISIANFSLDRGVDRIINIAEMFSEKKIKNIQFIFLGDSKIKSLKNFFISKKKYDLKSLVKSKNLKNINILGHKKNVEKYLDKSNLLLYLPRNDSSWGRNIIEALSHGVPVITVGISNILINNGKNGYFLKYHNERKIFRLIEKLNHDRSKLKKLSINAKKIASKKYLKKKITNKFLKFIEN